SPEYQASRTQFIETPGSWIPDGLGTTYMHILGSNSYMILAQLGGMSVRLAALPFGVKADDNISQILSLAASGTAALGLQYLQQPTKADGSKYGFFEGPGEGIQSFINSIGGKALLQGITTVGVGLALNQLEKSFIDESTNPQDKADRQAAFRMGVFLLSSVASGALMYGLMSLNSHPGDADGLVRGATKGPGRVRYVRNDQGKEEVLYDSNNDPMDMIGGPKKGKNIMVVLDNEGNTVPIEATALNVTFYFTRQNITKFVEQFWGINYAKNIWEHGDWSTRGPHPISGFTNFYNFVDNLNQMNGNTVFRALQIDALIDSVKANHQAQLAAGQNAGDNEEVIRSISGAPVVVRGLTPSVPVQPGSQPTLGEEIYMAVNQSGLLNPVPGLITSSFISSELLLGITDNLKGALSAGLSPAPWGRSILSILGLQRMYLVRQGLLSGDKWIGLATEMLDGNTINVKYLGDTGVQEFIQVAKDKDGNETPVKVHFDLGKITAKNAYGINLANITSRNGAQLAVYDNEEGDLNGNGLRAKSDSIAATMLKEAGDQERSLHINGLFPDETTALLKRNGTTLEFSTQYNGLLSAVLFSANAMGQNFIQRLGNNAIGWQSIALNANRTGERIGQLHGFSPALVDPSTGKAIGGGDNDIVLRKKNDP
ncbi:MAG: hypothetical protein JNN05_02640, partial [Candidatus Omnitrophica bacterium]|nr:hypothetical protein [Candidatus Omnitrophota bacterium]